MMAVSVSVFLYLEIFDRTDVLVDVLRQLDPSTVIAKKLRVNRTDLAEANYLKTTSRVRVGQKLLIPRMPSAALLARATAADAETAAAGDVLTDTAAVEDAEPTVYRVRAGDTLYGIARKHGTTVDQLKAWNKMRGTKLNIGDRLVVQSPKSANAQQ